jgi:hypothetical protein
MSPMRLLKLSAVVILVLLVVIQAYNMVLKGQLDDVLEKDRQATEQQFKLQAAKTKAAVTSLKGALLRLDSAKAVRPKVKIIRDTIKLEVKVPVAQDTLPKVMVVINDTAYATHVPVANALDHYKAEAALVDTVVRPVVDTVVVQVDTLTKSAETAVAAANKRPHWFKRFVAEIKEHAVTYVAGVTTGIIVMVSAR